MTHTIEELEAMLAGITPGTWHSEADTGPRSTFDGLERATVGVWSESRLYAAQDRQEQDPDYEEDPEDEKWVLGIWGRASEEDVANSRICAAAPDLARDLIEAKRELAVCADAIDAAILGDDFEGLYGASRDAHAAIGQKP